ncbi:DMP19 family protein [Nocardioides sp.]|uniref:DMP19 family protein n=1 Tax=Nocardioides sp. TaxID=35761 RepID=UPI002C04F2EA|nr:DUF4375 domain-containing protein [Nocardioides sp.]HXH81151.1 DUF4375 domain-containing protein [Nocardioides sp.]
MSDDPMKTALPLAIAAEEAAEDSASTVYSNVTVVNALVEKFLDEDEISQDALAAYYVDYYLAEVNNGGHDQFLFNSQLPRTVVPRLGQGLRAIGAPRHAEIFDRTIGAIDSLPAAEREAYLRSEGDSGIDLDAADDAFYELAEHENLTDLMASWLLSRPTLTLVPQAELVGWIDARAAEIDPAELERRREKARRFHEENMPDYERTIRDLCTIAGVELGVITAGDPSHVHKGSETVAWHFLDTTDRHFYMVDTGVKALMYDEADGSLVATMKRRRSVAQRVRLGLSALGGTGARRP